MLASAIAVIAKILDTTLNPKSGKPSLEDQVRKTRSGTNDNLAALRSNG
jgi:hypothetical protein